MEVIAGDSQKRSDYLLHILFFLLWLSYIFYHKKCRVYSGRISMYVLDGLT